MNVWVENKRAKTTFYTLKNSEKPVQNAVEELKKSIRLLTGAEVPSKEITQIDEVKNGVIFATFSALPKGLFAEEKEFLLENGEKYIVKSVHEKTNKKYWLFEGTEQLNKLLTEWRLRKH